MAPKYSPGPGYSTPQRPRNLLNKEEASRPSAWAPHFPPGLGSIRLPILTLFRGTYFADPFVSWQDNQYKPDNHEHGGSGGPSLRGRGKAMTMSLGVPGMTRRQTAVDLCLQVSSSRNSFSSHNGATVRQGKKKKKKSLFATFLSSPKAQYFNFTTDSILLTWLLSCGRNSSFQAEVDPPTSETKLHPLLGTQMFSADNLLENFLRERGKRGRGGNSSLFYFPISCLFLPWVTHLIKWTKCSDLLNVSPAGCSSY